MGCCQPHQEIKEISISEKFIREILFNFKISDLNFEGYQRLLVRLIKSNFSNEEFDKIITENFIHNRQSNKYLQYQIILIDDFNVRDTAIIDMQAWGFSFVRKKNKSIESYILKIIEVYKNQTYEPLDLVAFKSFLKAYLSYNIVEFTSRIKNMFNTSGSGYLEKQEEAKMKLSLENLCEEKFNNKVVKEISVRVISELEEILKRYKQKEKMDIDMLVNEISINEEHLFELNQTYDFLWDYMRLREYIYSHFP